VTDLPQLLHNTVWNSFNMRYRKAVDGILKDKVLKNLDKIMMYPIQVKCEGDLANEIARLANLSMVIGYRLEGENRVLTKEEAHQQLGHGAALFKGILQCAKRVIELSLGSMPGADDGCGCVRTV
jgi:hypothetical protein